MPRFRGLVAYRGSAFHGWQIQPDVRTVEGELTDALETITRTRSKVQGASRTDAGVHAEGQVMHFDYDGDMRPDQLRDGLNAVSSRDARVMTVEPCPSDFNARHSARGKLYRFDLYRGRAHHPLYRATSWQIQGQLDLAAMRSAARHFIGTHDFSCLRAAGCSAPSPILTLSRIDIIGDAPHITIMVAGNAFLKYMVRTLVGTLVRVGRGRRDPESIPSLIEAKDRSQAGDTARPEGLRLVYVNYPNFPWLDGNPWKTVNRELAP